MTTRKSKLMALIARLHERHNEECDKALTALERDDDLKFEYYRGSAAAILYTINDLCDSLEDLMS